MNTGMLINIERYIADLRNQILYLKKRMAVLESSQTQLRDVVNSTEGIVRYYTSETTLTMSNDYNRFVYVGGDPATWTMLDVVATTNKNVTIHNKGGAKITVNSNSGHNDFYDLEGPVNTKEILPGETYSFYNDNNHFIIY